MSRHHLGFFLYFVAGCLWWLGWLGVNAIFLCCVWLGWVQLQVTYRQLDGQYSQPKAVRSQFQAGDVHLSHGPEVVDEQLDDDCSQLGDGFCQQDFNYVYAVGTLQGVTLKFSTVSFLNRLGGFYRKSC